jgi:hypothetical protein
MPQQAEEAIAGYYLFAGSIMLALGLIPLVQRIQAKPFMRWILVSILLFFVYGIGNTIEDAIYSNTKGIILMTPILFVPCTVLAATLTLLFRPIPGKRFAETVSEFCSCRTVAQWTWRILLSVLLFPIVYFFFGIIVSPFVIEYYVSGVADLALPKSGTIVAIELLRGVMFVLSSIPLLIVWSGSKRQSVLFLGLAFFVLTATFEIVMAYQLPTLMRVIHTVEILADSFVYAWLLVLVLVPKETALKNEHIQN